MPVGLLMAFAGSVAGHSSALPVVLTLIPAGLWIGYLVVMGRRPSPAPEPGPEAPGR